jgi:hypothetical protein
MSTTLKIKEGTHAGPQHISHSVAVDGASGTSAVATAPAVLDEDSLYEAHPDSVHHVEAESPWANGVDWPGVIWIAFVHLGCLAAPFFFTWKAVLLTLVLGYITGGWGVCLGYHRHLTHGSFLTYKPIRWLLAFLGGIS